MKYDSGLEITNLDKRDFGNQKVEVSHKDAAKLQALERALAAEGVEHEFVVGYGKTKDKIVFKRIIWPKLNFALFQAGLLTLAAPKVKAEGP